MRARLARVLLQWVYLSALHVQNMPPYVFVFGISYEAYLTLQNFKSNFNVNIIKILSSLQPIYYLEAYLLIEREVCL
jgi:hypothetical protein